MEKSEFVEIANSIAESGPDNITDTYGKYADKYDEFLKSYGVLDSEILTAYLKSIGVPSDAPISEFGCGTGRTGGFLNEGGFSNIEGLDGSEGMLAKARAKPGIYRELHRVFFGAGEFPDALKGRFRVTVNVALFMSGHAPPSTISEMLDSLKGEEGDKLVFVIREDQFETQGYKQYLDDLIEQGRIKFIYQEKHARKTTFEGYEDSLFGQHTSSLLLHYEHTGKH